MTPPADVPSQGDEEMVAKHGTATGNRTAETARANVVGEVGRKRLTLVRDARAINNCGSNGASSLQSSQVTVSFTSTSQMRCLVIVRTRHMAVG